MTAEGFVKPVFAPGATGTSRECGGVLKGELMGGHNCDRAVPIRNVVLNDQRRTRLLDLVPAGRIELDQIDFTPVYAT